MQEMDDTVGTILQAVTDAGADEDTIVFFTSDNGPWLVKRLFGGSAGVLPSSAARSRVCACFVCSLIREGARVREIPSRRT